MQPFNGRQLQQQLRAFLVFIQLQIMMYFLFLHRPQQPPQAAPPPPPPPAIQRPRRRHNIFYHISIPTFLHIKSPKFLFHLLHRYALIFSYLHNLLQPFSFGSIGKDRFVHREGKCTFSKILIFWPLLVWQCTSCSTNP